MSMLYAEKPMLKSLFCAMFVEHLHFRPLTFLYTIFSYSTLNYFKGYSLGEGAY